jgi:hypothetical protein
MSDENPALTSKPPYAKYAFANPYNLATLGGLGAAALLTGNWWLGLLAAGFEVLWMVFAPDSRLLRRLWFDKRHATETAAAREAELAAKLAILPPAEADRCRALVAKHASINALARENPALTADLLGPDLQKLGDLVRAFTDLSITCARYREYLRTIDATAIERDRARYQEAVKQSKDPEKRALMQKNLSVLAQRQDKYEEIRGYLFSATGQLDLIENTFQLLADQIVTRRSPLELTGQLDDLINGVETAKTTAREAERMLQGIER